LVAQVHNHINRPKIEAGQKAKAAIKAIAKRATKGQVRSSGSLPVRPDESRRLTALIPRYRAELPAQSAVRRRSSVSDHYRRRNGAAGAVGRAKSLRYDAFAAQSAGFPEHNRAVTFEVLIDHER
jgi:hypothetical protein